MVDCRFAAIKFLHAAFGGSAAVGSKNRKTELRPLEMHPYPRCAVLLHGNAFHLVLRSVSLPYEPSSLATPIPGKNKLLYAFSRCHVAQFTVPIVSPRRGGKGGAVRHQRGIEFPSPKGRLACFPSPVRAIVNVLYKLAPLYFQRAPTSPL